MNKKEILKARQIKAARALLDWAQDKLAEEAGLSVATIRKLELGNISPRGKTNELIRHVFEEAGLEFIEPNGVRERPEGIIVYEGDEGIKAYLEDIYHTSLRNGSEIIQVWPSKNAAIKTIGDHRFAHAERMIAAQDRIKVKCILTEDPTYLPFPYIEDRFLSRHFIDFVPFYVYSDKYVIFPPAPDGKRKIVVIQSRVVADAFRRQFDTMWNKASPLITSAVEINSVPQKRRNSRK